MARTVQFPDALEVPMLPPGCRKHTRWLSLLLAAGVACQPGMVTSGEHDHPVQDWHGDSLSPGDRGVPPPDGDAPDGDAPALCSVLPAPGLTTVWPQPAKLPDTPCDAGITIRRAKLGRGKIPGTFALFYSTFGGERTIRAQAYTLGADGPQPLCQGDNFVVIDGGSNELMDFNVVRRDEPPLDTYYLAYTAVPSMSHQHDVHAAQIRFDLEACELEVVRDRLVKTLADNDCEKGGEPFMVDRHDAILFAEWWQEIGPDREPDCDLGTGDVGLRLRVLGYDLEESGEPPVQLLDGEPHTPDHRPIFMDPDLYSPFTRVFHALFTGGSYHVCYNASPDGLGMQSYNQTPSGTFMNLFCGRYEADLDNLLSFDPSCSDDVVDEAGRDELFLQGATLLPGGGGDAPLLVLYSHDCDGNAQCQDGTGRCFDELRLTDLQGSDLTVLPPGSHEWGPSEDGFLFTDPTLGGVAVVVAVRKDSHCPYLQAVRLAGDPPG
ncbi:hypothetical protein ACFL6C_00760 [Myxococcota bacterium]